MPRLVPSRSKLEPIVRQIEEQLGVQSAENGRLAFVSFTDTVQQLLKQDSGKQGMPTLEEFDGGARRFPIIVSLDATGYGKMQFNTIALNNPYNSKSAQNLRIIGLGNCGDDRSGSTRLLAGNLDEINEILVNDPFLEVAVDGRTYSVKLDLGFTFDVAALRHCEHLANSGWCGCSREKALRVVPEKPKDISEMHAACSDCESPTRIDRFVKSHMCVPGESLPRACTAPGCSFGHNRETVKAEHAQMLATEQKLSAVKTKAGKSAWSRHRMAHAHAHGNVRRE